MCGGASGGLCTPTETKEKKYCRICGVKTTQIPVLGVVGEWRCVRDPSHPHDPNGDRAPPAMSGGIGP